MSHKAVAAVWAELQRRPDIDHILRELIGQYSLDLCLHRGDHHRLREISYNHIVALKTIFDLQRTYLQSSHLSHESRSSLLHHDLLFAAIVHLLDLKAESHRFSDHHSYCSLLAQVLLSGLRALLLRKRSLTSKDFDTLTSRFDEVWASERLEDVTLFVVQSLCRRIIQELFKDTPNSKYASPACGIVHLPDFFHKLYPVEAHEGSLAVAARNARCLSSSFPDWFQNTLTLYDIYWSTLSALIQLCVDSQKRKDPYHWTSADELARQNGLNDIMATRFKLLNQIYSIDSPRGAREDDEWIHEQMKSVLLLGNSPICSQDKCLCFDDSRLVIERLRLSLSAQDLPTRMNRSLSSLPYLDELENALNQLHHCLGSRAAALLDCNGEIEDLSRKLEGYLEEWCPSVYPLAYDGKSLPVQEFYVIACPELHAVPAKDLYNGFVEAFVGEERRQSDNPLLVGIQSSFRCPRCTWDSQIISARKIEPLSRISSQLQERLRVWQEIMQKRIDLQQRVEVIDLKSGFELKPRAMTISNCPSPALPRFGGAHSNFSSPNLSIAATISPRSPMFQLTDVDDLPEVVTESAPPISPRPESLFSKYSESDSTSLTPKNSSRRQYTWQSLFKPSRSMSSVLSLPKCAFFASGRTLLLWNQRGLGFYDFSHVESVVFRRVISCNVQVAAGGTNQFAIVSKIERDHTFSVFQVGYDEPIFQHPIEGSPFALAVSRNDHFIALKFSRHVKIFDVRSKKFFYHEIPHRQSRSGSNNHLVAFSSDSSSFIASTRFEPEKVITYWSECTNPSKTNRVESSAPFGLIGDDGLSSLVYSSNMSHWAFLATFTEKGFPVFLGLSESRPVCHQLRDNSKQIGARIHRATLCAAGINLVVMNQRNEIFWLLDAFGAEKEARYVTIIKRPVSVKRDVELGMPNSDEVHVFWIDKSRGKLVTVGKSGGKSKPLDLDVDMSQLLP